MPYGAFTFGRSFEFSDAILATPGANQDIRTIVGDNANFVPAAVYIDSSSDQNEEALGYATIRGYLAGENDRYIKSWRVTTRVPIGLAFARIYSTGTTARGIKVGDGK